MWVVPISKAKLSSETMDVKTGQSEWEILNQRVVLGTKVTVPAVFFVFNIFYWGYILGYWGYILG